MQCAQGEEGTAALKLGDALLDMSSVPDGGYILEILFAL